MARVEGMRDAANLLGDIAGRLRDPAPALRAEAELVKREAAAAITARRAPDGSSWPAVKTTSDGRGGRKASPRKPERRSGRLGRSGSVKADGDGIAVKFTAPYAGFVNDGTEDMEPRRFVPQGNEGPLAGTADRVGDYVVKGQARR